MYARYAEIHHKRKGEDKARLRLWTDAFGKKSAISIRPHMVEEVMAKMSTEGYKPATIHRALTI